MKPINRTVISSHAVALFLLASFWPETGFAAFSPQASAFDLWDWRNHAEPVFHSQFGMGSSPEAMFGYRDVQDGRGEFRFDADYMEDGVGFVEWRLRKPERIRCFRLLARHDLPRPERAIGEFRLFTRRDPDSPWQLRHRFRPPVPYGEGTGDWLEHTVTNVMIEAQEFRAEFTAAMALGPRIVELDAFATAAPPRECWDALQGTRTIRSSGIRPGSRGDDLLGQTRSLPTAGAMHFRDGGPRGFVVWLEFRALESRTVRSFRFRRPRVDRPPSRNVTGLQLSGYDRRSKRWRPLLIEDRLHHSFDPQWNQWTTQGALKPFSTDRWRIELKQEGLYGGTLSDLEGYLEELPGSVVDPAGENP